MSRLERVEALIRAEISDILRAKVSDPRIGFTSITRVKVSPDFHNASVYVSIFDEEKNKAEAMKGLYSATGFVQHELGQRLEMRVTPKIQFMRDDSIEQGSRVLGIISQLKHGNDVKKNKRSSRKV